MSRKHKLEVKKRQAKEDLRNLLRKLGIKSANIIIFGAGTLTEKDITDMMNRVQANYGSPDQIYMSPTSLRKFKNAFKK